jgi:hypothetical protein
LGSFRSRGVSAAQTSGLQTRCRRGHLFNFSRRYAQINADNSFVFRLRLSALIGGHARSASCQGARDWVRFVVQGCRRPRPPVCGPGAGAGIYSISAGDTRRLTRITRLFSSCVYRRSSAATLVPHPAKGARDWVRFVVQGTGSTGLRFADPVQAQGFTRLARIWASVDMPQ